MIYTLQVQGRLDSLDVQQLGELQRAVISWKKSGIVREDVNGNELERLVLDDLTLRAETHDWGRERRQENSGPTGSGAPLSFWAEQFLIRAAASQGGSIVPLQHGTKYELYSDGKLIASNNGGARGFADFDAALEELVSHKFVSREIGYYKVTRAGYLWFDERNRE